MPPTAGAKLRYFTDGYSLLVLFLQILSGYSLISVSSVSSISKAAKDNAALTLSGYIYLKKHGRFKESKDNYRNAHETWNV